jgi:5'-nucleotidase
VDGLTDRTTRADDAAPGPDTELEVDTRPNPPRGRCRVLVTNDDGLEAPGLHGLARTLAADHEVLVAAPRENVSGAGTSIGRIEAADPTRLDRRDLDGLEAYALEGPPGLAVMAAHLGAFGDPPELVVSGVNAGLNTGTSIIHSGTVGAALTARTFGVSGLAISLAPSDPWHWETALPFARRAVAWLARQGTLTTLNVNTPGVPLDAVQGVTWAAVDRFGHFNVASQRADGTVLELGVRDRRSGTDPDSDTARCLAGHVTLTALAALGAVAPPAVDAEEVVGPPPAAARPDA